MTTNLHAMFLGSIFFPIFSSLQRFPISSVSLSSICLFIFFISTPTLLLYLAAHISTHQWLISTCLIIAILFSFILSISAGGVLISGVINLFCIAISFIVLLVAAWFKLHRRLTCQLSGTDEKDFL